MKFFLFLCFCSLYLIFLNRFYVYPLPPPTLNLVNRFLFIDLQMILHFLTTCQEHYCALRAYVV